MLTKELYQELDSVRGAFVRSERVRREGKRVNTKRKFDFSLEEENFLMSCNHVNPLMKHILEALGIRKAYLPIYTRKGSSRGSKLLQYNMPLYPKWQKDLKYWLYPGAEPFDSSDVICSGYPPICMAILIAMENGVTEPFYNYIRERYANKTGDECCSTDEGTDESSKDCSAVCDS